MKKLFIVLVVALAAVLVIAQSKSPIVVVAPTFKHTNGPAVVGQVLTATATDGSMAWSNAPAGTSNYVNLNAGWLIVTNDLNVWGNLNVNSLTVTNPLGSNQVRLAITNLTDVSVPARAEGDQLFWNAVMFKWTNAQPAAGGSAPGNSNDIVFNGGGGILRGTNAFTYDTVNSRVTLTDAAGGSILTLDGEGITESAGNIDLGFGVNGYQWAMRGTVGGVLGDFVPTSSNTFSVGSSTATASNVWANKVNVTQRLGINTNADLTAAALHVVSRIPTNPSIFRIDETNGVPKFHMGSFPGLPTYSTIWGPVVPSAVNYMIANDSGNTLVQGTIIQLNSGNSLRWQVESVAGHFLPGADLARNIGSPTARTANIFTHSLATYRSNLVASAAITIGASGSTWTNNTVSTTLTNNVTVYVDCSTATTVGTISKNGQQIFASVATSGVTVNLKPNEIITFAYTGTAPTARWEPW